MARDKRKENTKKALFHAMVTCLEKNNFNDITTIELAKTAGISRSSFYTHYKDKYEMIEYYQQDFFKELEHIILSHDGNKAAALLDMFTLLAKDELLSALLSHNGTQELQGFILNKVRLLLSKDLGETTNRPYLTLTEKEYTSIYFSHAIVGICQSWISNGKKESPQEMTNFLMKLLP